MQLFFKGHFQPIVFQKLKDWKLEISCTKDNICLLDHHQRSLWNTITIGLKEMINRVLQLNISQLENSFNNHLEKHFILVLPNQPNSLNPLKIERGKLVTQEIVGKLQGELSSSDRTGEPVKNEETRVMRNHDRTRELVERSSNKVQEVRSLKIRDDANKFNLAMDDENINFNISGVPNRKALTFTTWFSKLRTTFNERHFKVIFNNIDNSILSAKSQKMRLWLLGTQRWAEITVQNMLNAVEHMHM